MAALGYFARTPASNWVYALWNSALVTVCPTSLVPRLMTTALAW